VDQQGRCAVLLAQPQGRQASFTFDIDLALKRNDENPVFYVQYAHARICSVIRQFVDGGGDEASLAQTTLRG